MKNDNELSRLDLPLEQDMGVDEEYAPVPKHLLTVLFALSCVGIGCFIVAAVLAYGGN